MSTILELRNLTRTHGQGEQGVQALRNVDLSVEAGELVAVMGSSGSGKSTLLTCAGGLDPPTAGEVLVDGNDLTSLSRNAVAALRRRRIGYVFQDFNLIPALTDRVRRCAGDSPLTAGTPLVDHQAFTDLMGGRHRPAVAVGFESGGHGSIVM